LLLVVFCFVVVFSAFTCIETKHQKQHTQTTTWTLSSLKNQSKNTENREKNGQLTPHSVFVLLCVFSLNAFVLLRARWLRRHREETRQTSNPFHLFENKRWLFWVLFVLFEKRMDTDNEKTQKKRHNLAKRVFAWVCVVVVVFWCLFVCFCFVGTDVRQIVWQHGVKRTLSLLMVCGACVWQTWKKDGWCDVVFVCYKTTPAPLFFAIFQSLLASLLLAKLKETTDNHHGHNNTHTAPFISLHVVFVFLVVFVVSVLHSPFPLWFAVICLISKRWKGCLSRVSTQSCFPSNHVVFKTHWRHSFIHFTIHSVLLLLCLIIQQTLLPKQKQAARSQIGQDHPPNLSISISGGKETNEDSLSSGERNGKSSSF